MRSTIKTRVAIVATLFVMALGITSVNAQLLYKDSHLFVGQAPTNTTVGHIGVAPNVIIGPKFGIEHNYGGLNFYILYPEANWGDYKIFISENGKVGIGRKPTTYALEVSGQVWTTAGLLITSDETKKRSIKDMELQRSDYLKKLKQLKGKTYEKLIESGNDNAAEVDRMVAAGKIRKEDASAALQELNARKKDTYKSEYGFIAQDVKKLFPELVEENAEGILAVNYTGLIPVLLEAIKDLQDKVDVLELRNSNNISTRSSDYTANDEIADNNEYLSQNAPNPVDGSTVIRYNLPEGVTQASIVIYSTNGAVVKFIPIDASAKSGSITLYASELAKGLNVYNLTANGVILGSKKMINN